MDFYYRANGDGSQHDAFHNAYPDMPPPAVIRVTYFDGMDEPAVEMWHKLPADHCTEPDASQYRYTSVNGPWVRGDAAFADALTSMEVHMFSRGSATGDTARRDDAAQWARRYGWEG